MATVEQLMDVGAGLDRTWLLLTSGVIFTMQISFALLESGNVRRKNTHVIWQRTFINAVITVWTWWLIGYAIGFGGTDDRFIGGVAFFAGDAWDNGRGDVSTQYYKWLYEVVTAMVVNAVVNLSLSERLTLKASAIHTFFMSSFIYPVIVAWTWGDGWLAVKREVHDYAGSGVVFVTASAAALAGLILVGPRLNNRGAFRVVGEPQSAASTRENQRDLETLRQKVESDQYESFGVTSVSATVAGGLLLWFQFTFFAANSDLNMSSSAYWMGAEKAAVNTFLAGSSSATFGLLLKFFIASTETKRVLREESKALVNSFLAGVIAVLAGANTYEPWEALVIGAIASIFYLAACAVFLKLKVDDPLEAFQVYGIGGMCGLGCEAFFNHTNGIFHSNPTHGNVLGRQIFGWFMIFVWSFIFSFIVYLGLKVTKTLRVNLKTEVVGYDFIDYADQIYLENLVKRDTRNMETEKNLTISGQSPYTASPI